MGFTHNNMLVAGIAVVFIAAAAVMFFIFRTSGSSGASASASSPVLPDMVFKNTANEEVSVSSLRGRPVLFNMWASWCSLCTQKIADLVLLQKEFGDKIIIVEVNRGESVETVKRYADQYGAGNLLFVLDANESLYREIKGFSMPETLFLDKDGNIADHTRGITGIEDMRRRIQDAFGL